MRDPARTDPGLDTIRRIGMPEAAIPDSAEKPLMSYVEGIFWNSRSRLSGR